MFKTTYVKGDHRVICDRTGFERLRSQCRYEWTGSLVLDSEWEPRQPQDFVRGVPDGQPVKDIRPDTEPEFVGLCGKPVTLEDI